MPKDIIIGTRGSELALWQANHVKNALEQAGASAKLSIIKTQGDKIQSVSLTKLEGKGFFTKELEDALLAGAIDCAVHSLKDLPTDQVEGLVIAGVTYREDPADWLILRKEAIDTSKILNIKEGADIGTGSVRRKLQLHTIRPDLVAKDIRGNIPTRIAKLRSGEYDGLMLAAAGIRRLDMDLGEFEIIRLHPNEFIPAPGQGVVAIQCRKDDTDLRRIIKNIHHPEVSVCTNIERSVLKQMGGGCHLPLGVHCTKDAAGYYHTNAIFGNEDMTSVRRARYSSSTIAGLADQIVSLLKS